MNANPVLLQKKYARVVECFAKEQRLPLDAALDLFYRSEVYQLISHGVSDMHCRSDEYLAEELRRECADHKPEKKREKHGQSITLPESGDSNEA